MALSDSNAGRANTGQLFGEQTNARVIGVPDGGYVVAWENTNTADGLSNISAQKFNASGVAVGEVVTMLDFIGGLALTDITFGNGRVVLAGYVTGSSFAVVRQFDPVTLAAVTPATTLSAAQFVTNVSVLVQASGQVSTYVDSAVTPAINTSASSLQRGVVDTVGVVSTPLTTLTTNATNITTRDVVQSSVGELAIQNNGRLVDTTGASKLISTGAQDIIEIAPGLLIASASGTSSVFLSAVFSQSGSVASTLPQLSVGPSIVSGAIGTTSFLEVHEIFNLGNGRILTVAVTVNGTAVATVTNTNTGAREQVNIPGPTGISIGATHQDFGSAALLADGRVVFVSSSLKGMTGADIFARFIDPRDNVPVVTTFTGTAAAEVMTGTSASDVFLGVGLGDTIEGMGGTNTVIFGETAGLDIDLINGTAVQSSNIVLLGVQNLTGNIGDDRLLGDGFGNVLDGAVGDDTLNGRSGADTLIGGAGSDSINGGTGNDNISGGADNDLLFGDSGNDLVLGDAGNDMLNGGAGDDQTYGGLGNDRVFGASGNDDLYGGDGNDAMDGGAGDDFIAGDAGNDSIVADLGSDSVFGGAGNDRITIYSAAFNVDGGTGTDTVVISAKAVGADSFIHGFHLDLANEYDLLGNAKDYDLIETFFSGVENVTGSAGDDFLKGDAASNVINGGAGDDFILGRIGNDTLTGGAGADQFVFLDSKSGADIIRDFVVGQDRIALDADGFGDVFNAGIATRLNLNATGAFAANGNAQFAFDNAGSGGGRLTFDADGNGAGTSVLIATITFVGNGLTTFSASDFIFL